MLTPTKSATAELFVCPYCDTTEFEFMTDQQLDIDEDGNVPFDDIDPETDVRCLNCEEVFAVNELMTVQEVEERAEEVSREVLVRSAFQPETSRSHTPFGYWIAALAFGSKAVFMFLLEIALFAWGIYLLVSGHIIAGILFWVIGAAIVGFLGDIISAILILPFLAIAYLFGWRGETVR